MARKNNGSLLEGLLELAMLSASSHWGVSLCLFLICGLITAVLPNVISSEAIGGVVLTSVLTMIFGIGTFAFGVAALYSGIKSFIAAPSPTKRTVLLAIPAFLVAAYILALGVSKITTGQKSEITNLTKNSASVQPLAVADKKQESSHVQTGANSEFSLNPATAINNQVNKVTKSYVDSVMDSSNKQIFNMTVKPFGVKWKEGSNCSFNAVHDVIRNAPLELAPAYRYNQDMINRIRYNYLIDALNKGCVEGLSVLEKQSSRVIQAYSEFSKRLVPTEQCSAYATIAKQEAESGDNDDLKINKLSKLGYDAAFKGCYK